MKIAVAMLCHKNVQQINLLLRAMENENISFFIHVDRKSTISRDDISGKNITVIPKVCSVDIQWGGFGMVEATLRLIETIRQSNQKYDYIWLMSGQDWPLHPSDEIIKYVEQHNGEDFIEILPDKESFERGYWKRNELYYPNWMVSNDTYIKVVKHLFWFMTGGRKSTNVCKRRTRVEKFYYGSQWWLLSKHSIDAMMFFLKSNEWYTDYFKHSLVPDESFFQTLYGRVIGVKKARPAVCYVNWKENRNSPEVLTCDDLGILEKEKERLLLARKVDFDSDSDLAKL
ncbi:beta-1,6-N-acetylglucosaminyltransferase [Pygmaiobacter massiliensis]|uniref:beta-1,6-N-acetylglucosaminyltransferase n=1 Tax=Pygmaiobacter massiliensis TaxID=1917873 RepID=UPI000C7D1A95|nr:beta-1,6-N-acetylglucosaminyltransferase [Pygmaiobacter massiliensis]